MDDRSKESEALLGQAAIAVWADLSRESQELLFEAAVASDADSRARLALFLHDRHPKTSHPPKPSVYERYDLEAEPGDR
jgi:hypothetical protein